MQAGRRAIKTDIGSNALLLQQRIQAGLIGGLMKLAARYPGYGWECNAGYATREHRMAILERGLTPFHRRSFHALDVLLGGEQQTFDLEIEIDPEELELEELSALAG